MRVWIDESVVVDADIETVSALLGDVRRWPRWVPGLRAIRLLGSGRVVAGRRFSMTLAMPPIRWLWLPNVMYVMSPTLIEWGGGLPGMKIRHGVELTAVGEAKTLVRQYEYATSVFGLICRPFERAIFRHDHGWLMAVRARYAGGSTH